MVAGIAFITFYLLLRFFLRRRKIQPKFPKVSDYAREIGYSAITISIFSVVTLVFLKIPFISKYTTLYTDINAYSRFYFFAIFPVMFLMHDTYFYWTHRLMHHKKLFRLFHLVHHQSTNLFLQERSQNTGQVDTGPLSGSRKPDWLPKILRIQFLLADPVAYRHLWEVRNEL